MTWLDVFVQWAFFFALLTVFFFPAFRFTKLAKRFNKRGWVYFFVGLAVGIVGLNLGHIVVFPLRYYVVPKEHLPYLSPVLFLSSYIFYRFSYKYLEKKFSQSHE